MAIPNYLDGLTMVTSNFSKYYTEIENIIISLGKSPTSSKLMDSLVQRLEFVNQGLSGDELEVIEEVAIELVTLLNLAKDSSIDFEKQIGEIILMSIDHIGDACHQVLNEEKFDEKLTYQLVVTLRHINRQPNLLEGINTSEAFKFLSIPTAKNI
jgi:chemotaxis protein histidine kinase CheA